MYAQGIVAQKQDSTWATHAFLPSVLWYNIMSCFDWSCAGVVLAAASKCDTPNVKAVPPSHRGLPRPSTGEPKRQAAGQKSSKGEQPGRLHRAASAEAAQSAASAEAGLAGGRQASAPPAALKAAAAQVGIYAEQPLASIGSYVFTVISCRPLHVDSDDHLLPYLVGICSSIWFKQLQSECTNPCHHSWACRFCRQLRPGMVQGLPLTGFAVGA